MKKDKKEKNGEPPSLLNPMMANLDPQKTQEAERFIMEELIPGKRPPKNEIQKSILPDLRKYQQIGGQKEMEVTDLEKRLNTARAQMDQITGAFMGLKDILIKDMVTNDKGNI